MRFFLFLLVSASFLIASTKFEETYRIYKSGDFVTSFKTFKTLAKEEDEDAAYILAYMYEHGEGCEIDMAEANRWYKTASKSYYFRGKKNTNRDINKEKRKLYESLERIEDKDTAETIRKYSQSLYNIKAHKTIYFLPASYRFNNNYPATNGHDAKKLETEFQISLKFDFTANLLNLNEVYSLAYTQLSFWQLYEESAYFRETNYNPEIFVTFPISEIYDNKFIKALRISLEHESNGRGGVKERSWNFLSTSLFFQYKTLFTELKLWHRLPDEIDYNPELIDYMGHGHLRFILPYKKSMTELTLRSNFSAKNMVELSYSYPALWSEDIFLYIKAFSGYGESLIDYDNSINKIGLGFSITR